MLRNIKIPPIVRNIDDVNNISNSFIIPSLREAIKYDRATAFFSIDGLLDLFVGLMPFIKNNGNIRCITSIELNQKEQDIIGEAYQIKKQKMIHQIEEEIKRDLDLPVNELLALDVITNLIAANRLIIKFAYLKNGALYHEKFGFISDSEGNCVYFIGSSNETLYGSKLNREAIHTITSWSAVEQYETIKQEQSYFDLLWDGNDYKVDVFSFPDALKNELFQRYKLSESLGEACLRYEGRSQNGRGKELRPYQKEAIQLFINNNGRAFFEMATGTGKTFTAIRAIRELLEKQTNPLFVLILVPLTDLQNQWDDELKKEGIDSYLVGGDGDLWSKNTVVTNFLIKKKSLFCVCVYNSYFQKFYLQLSGIAQKVVVVVDEAHNLSPSYLKNLSRQFPYRLGLSATPSRFKQSETNAILAYFLNSETNEKPFVFSLKDAIGAGYLSHYLYYPIIVYLNEDEEAKYADLSKKVAGLMSIEHRTKQEDERLTGLLSRRSMIIKHAESKFSKLDEMVISNKYNFKNAVVYCGRGSALDDDKSNEERSLEKIIKIINSKKGIRASNFIDKTPNRKEVLERFKEGELTTLVAIKCLDEGIDIPSLERLYVMASDMSSRQTIQRRGRVLRICKETGKQIAYIYDMIALPLSTQMKSLVIAELTRLKDYAELSDNQNDSDKILKGIERKYSITTEDYIKCLMDQQDS